MNEKAYNMVIKRCCALIREEMRGKRDFYKRLVPMMDKVVANNPSIKEPDIAQEQWDARQRLWESLFQEYAAELQSLLNILNKKIRKDDATHN